MHMLNTFLGILAGIITGLIPALHINQVAQILSTIPLNESFLPFFIAIAITHSFLDFIPTILLGIPNEYTIISSLPGSYYLAKGKAFYAIKLTLYGSFFAVIYAVFLYPLYSPILLLSLNFLKLFAKYFLIFVLTILLLTEHHKKYALFAISSSFLLGIISLKFLNIQNPFAPLIIGFFPLSQCIISSLAENPKFPKQKISQDKFPKDSIIYAFFGFIAGLISSIFAILSPAQMAFLISFLFSSHPSTFLITLGAINTSYLLISFLSSYMGFAPHSLIAIKAYENFSFSSQQLPLIFSVALLVASLAYIIGFFLSKIIIKEISSINYANFSKLMLLFLILYIYFTSGFLGLLLAFTATTIGMLCILSGVKKSHCMCFLLATFV